MWQRTLTYLFVALIVSSFIAVGLGLAGEAHCGSSAAMAEMASDMQMDVCGATCMTDEGGCSMQTSCTDLARQVRTEANLSYVVTAKPQFRKDQAVSAVIPILIPPPKIV
ncbi:hypothetical protein GUA87_01280 [Sneathiella sp. P13V-1]|uniref:hypothetical protein n=1 Tax=Sneathiella sp. P13V-1 TaxID=2697366 RepID=UPI00187B5533|nr:hypothetical protein [Sneathiella sp. P13V-1]MBE7635461.1 hypothetical protein [Sneathiella sp. P13V-1]